MTPPLNPQILEEAAAWFIEFRAGGEHRGGSVASAAHEQFLSWLRRSPEHIRAYLEISETYARLPASETVPPAEAARLMAHLESRLQDGVVPLVVPVNEWAARPQTAPRRSTDSPSAWSRPWRPLAIAASVLLLVGVVIIAYLWNARGLYTTGPGEERTVTLEDASRIELNARTRLRVRYTAGTREVELLEGQALFQVAKDKSRPFLVYSGDATVRAVGTQFDVYRKDTGTTVTVIEGRVAVYSTMGAEPTTATPGLATAGTNTTPSHTLPGTSSSHSQSTGSPYQNSTARLPESGLADPSGSAAPAAGGIFLSAGEQVTVTPEGVPAPQPANVSAATAWTRGQLEFEETPLAEVANEFNRLSTRTLVLTSPALSNVRISGVYSSVDPASLILFLRSQPDLVVTETGNQIEVQAKSR